MIKSAADLLTLENEVYKAFLFWSGVLALKVLGMSLLTGLHRFKNLTFANPEDCVFKKFKVRYDDVDVERVRRAHRNDMENIFPFFFIGFLYILTNPSVFLAVNLYRTVAIARIVHTFVYAVHIVPQPARVLAFHIAFSVTAYMAFSVMCYAF